MLGLGILVELEKVERSIMLLTGLVELGTVNEAEIEDGAELDVVGFVARKSANRTARVADGFTMGVIVMVGEFVVLAAFCTIVTVLDVVLLSGVPCSKQVMSSPTKVTS